MNNAVTPTWKAHFAGSIPKHAEFPECNEDKFIVSDEQQRYIISDGASESFNSALWASIVVEAWFNRRPVKNYLAWLQAAIDEYELRSDRNNLGWAKAAAFDRGSFASLLACEIQPDSSLLVTAVGDSLAVVVRDGMMCDLFPYTTAEQFGLHPMLLSTIRSRNLIPTIVDGVRSIRHGEQKGPCHVIWHPEGDRCWTILLMTDALGQWLLSEEEGSHLRLNRLLQVSNIDDLSELVETARQDRCMKRDDSTLIILGEREYADAAIT